MGRARTAVGILVLLVLAPLVSLPVVAMRPAEPFAPSLLSFEASPSVPAAAPAPSFVWEWVELPGGPQVVNHRLVVRGDLVLVVGGYTGSGLLNETPLFDATIGAWGVPLPPPPTLGFSGAATTLDNGTVLALSGSTGANVTGAAAFLLPNDQWLPIPPIDTPLMNSSLVQLDNGTIVVVGGSNTTDGSPTPQATVRTYSSDGQWHADELPQLPAVAYEHTATLLDNGSLAIVGAGGGFQRPNVTASGATFVLEDGAWRTLPSLTDSRGGHGAQLLPDGQVLVLGGYDSTGVGYDTPNALNSTELLSSFDGTWSAGPSLSEARLGSGVASLADGTVVAIGGYGPSDSRLSSVEALAPGSGQWMPLPAAPYAVASAQALVLPTNGSILVVGGYAGTDPSDKLVPTARSAMLVRHAIENATLDVSLDPDGVLQPGDNATLELQLTNATGVPLPSVWVDLTTTLSEVTIDEPQLLTDGNGSATTTVRLGSDVALEPTSVNLTVAPRASPWLLATPQQLPLLLLPWPTSGDGGAVDYDLARWGRTYVNGSGASPTSSRSLSLERTGSNATIPFNGSDVLVEEWLLHESVDETWVDADRTTVILRTAVEEQWALVDTRAVVASDRFESFQLRTHEGASTDALNLSIVTNTTFLPTRALLDPRAVLIGDSTNARGFAQRHVTTTDLDSNLSTTLDEVVSFEQVLFVSGRSSGRPFPSQAQDWTLSHLDTTLLDGVPLGMAEATVVTQHQLWAGQPNVLLSAQTLVGGEVLYTDELVQLDGLERPLPGSIPPLVVQLSLGAGNLTSLASTSVRVDVSDGSAPLPNASVTLSALGASLPILSIDNGTTDPNGSLVATIQAPLVSAPIAAQIVASVGAVGFLPASANVTVQLLPDLVGPILTHIPPALGYAGANLTLQAQASDTAGVRGVSAFVRTSGSGSDFVEVPLGSDDGTTFEGTIDGASVEQPGVEYYLIAIDGAGATAQLPPGGTMTVPVAPAWAAQPLLTASYTHFGGTIVEATAGVVGSDGSLEFSPVLDPLRGDTGLDITFQAEVHLQGTLHFFQLHVNATAAALPAGVELAQLALYLWLPSTQAWAELARADPATPGEFYFNQTTPAQIEGTMATTLSVRSRQSLTPGGPSTGDIAVTVGPVTDASSHPLQGAKVSLVVGPAGTTSYPGFTGTDGRVTIRVPRAWVGEKVNATVTLEGYQPTHASAVLQANGSLPLGALVLTHIPPRALPWIDPAAVIILVIALALGITLASVVRKPASLEGTLTRREDDDRLATELVLPGDPDADDAAHAAEE